VGFISSAGAFLLLVGGLADHIRLELSKARALKRLKEVEQLDEPAQANGTILKDDAPTLANDPTLRKRLVHWE
jgi:hypothetical protein